MFNQTGNLKNITEKEREKRERRIELKKNDIIANMRPFSFYDKDFASFVTRKNQECIPPEFIPFKANPIKWRSQIKMYDGMMENDNARKERNQRRAEELLAKAALPPRMEMHEKQKKLLQEEEKKMEKERIKQDKERRLFQAKKAPNFERLHEKFINTLEKKKRAAHPTIPKPFTFHEPKKKADLCHFLDYENNPKAKNPKKNKSIEKIRKTMQKKPKYEELNIHSSKKYIEEKDDIFGHNKNELGNISWSNNLQRNASFIDSIFMFQLQSNLKCRKCHTVKYKFETNYMFDLPLSLCKMVTVEIYLYKLPFNYKLYYAEINEKFRKNGM